MKLTTEKWNKLTTMYGYLAWWMVGSDTVKIKINASVDIAMSLECSDLVVKESAGMPFDWALYEQGAVAEFIQRDTQCFVVARQADGTFEVDTAFGRYWVLSAEELRIKQPPRVDLKTSEQPKAKPHINGQNVDKFWLDDLRNRAFASLQNTPLNPTIKLTAPDGHEFTSEPLRIDCTEIDGDRLRIELSIPIARKKVFTNDVQILRSLFDGVVLINELGEKVSFNSNGNCSVNGVETPIFFHDKFKIDKPEPEAKPEPVKAEYKLPEPTQLGINPEMDKLAREDGLGHWSCVSRKSNAWWRRSDGVEWDGHESFHDSDKMSIMDYLKEYDEKYPIAQGNPATDPFIDHITRRNKGE